MGSNNAILGKLHGTILKDAEGFLKLRINVVLSKKDGALFLNWTKETGNVVLASAKYI